MAVSLAFGVLFATVVTLLLIPSLYLVIEDIKQVFSRKKKSQIKVTANKGQASVES
jgi:predicted RND superfamily exporter protein